MARNQGKRPGAAKGSSSPSQAQARDAGTQANKAADGKTDAASSGGGQSSGGQATSNAPPAASKAIAAKIEKTGSGSATAAGAAKASGEASKVTSSVATTAATSTSVVAAKASSTETDRSKGASSATASSSRTTPSSPATTGKTASGGGSQSGAASSNGGSGGFWPGVVGGVIGGAATALAASLFWVGGDDAATNALESRLAAAEQQVGEIGGLNDRLAAIEAAPSGAAEDGGMAARIDDLEARLAEIGGAAPGGEPGEGVGEEINERLASLEQQFQALASEVQTAGQTQAANAQALTSLESALPTLEETLAATGVSLGEASEQTSALSQTVDSLNGNIETLTTRVGEAESRLDYLGGEYQRGAAMIVAIGDINQAVTSAEPFDNSLETLKSLVSADSPIGGTLSILEPMAAGGVPTLGDLKSAFGEMASSVLLAEEGDQSLTDQVSDNVFGIFNMRPAGADVEGSGSRSILARAQSKLSADDLNGAIGELTGLEGPAAEKAAVWTDRANAKLAAEAAVVDLRVHAQALVAKGS
ncbi:MAG: mitofilin family membrane protein [Pseudomonadota bacterium]